MREYDRDEYEDYEGYEDDGYEQEGYEQEEYEDGGEEEYEEEEERKPTKEEVEYLELRQKLKEKIRKKLNKESSSGHSNSQEKKKKLPSDNYGSFFGPSQPVIAQRVIHESKSLLENPHLASKLDSLSHKKKSAASTTTGSKHGVHDRPPKVNELQRQVQKRRETRDYSFLLSDDTELPAPAKDPPPRSVSTPISDARPAQVPSKNKRPLGNGPRINVHGGSQERKPVSLNGGSQERRPVSMNGGSQERKSVSMNSGSQERKSVSMNGGMHSKAATHKLASASKSNLTSIVSRKQLGSNNGVGPGRPSGPKPLPSKTPHNVSDRKPPVSMERKASAPMEKRAFAPMENKSSAPMEKKVSAAGVKNILPASHKPPPSKMQSSLPKQHLEQRKGLPDPYKGKAMSKQPVVSSKPQMHRPVKPISSRPMSQDDRPKKRPSRPFPDDDDEDTMALNMIRRMFNTQRYADAPDSDSDMEAGFDEIMAEEKRSARIARKEDEEQLRLIEEEERRARMRKLAKKRKLSQQ